MSESGALVVLTLTGKLEVRGEKPFPVPRCPQKSNNDCNQLRAFVLERQANTGMGHYITRYHVFRDVTTLISINSQGKIKGEMDVTRRRGRRRKKLLDDLKARREYSHLKEEALDRTMWRNRFGRGFGPVVRQTTE